MNSNKQHTTSGKGKSFPNLVNKVLYSFKSNKADDDNICSTTNNENGGCIISGPFDPVHITHIDFDAKTGQFVGLPLEWQRLRLLEEREEANSSKASR